MAPGFEAIREVGAHGIIENMLKGITGIHRPTACMPNFMSIPKN